MTRDPHIKKHDVRTLRSYAVVFREEAGRLRVQADNFDAKAKRYEARARRIEVPPLCQYCDRALNDHASACDAYNPADWPVKRVDAYYAREKKAQS
jgi:hypothetical protein